MARHGDWQALKGVQDAVSCLTAKNRLDLGLRSLLRWHFVSTGDYKEQKQKTIEARDNVQAKKDGTSCNSRTGSLLACQLLFVNGGPLNHRIIDTSNESLKPGKTALIRGQMKQGFETQLRSK